jgi:putative permease
MTLRHVIERWFQRYFSDPQAILLAILLAVGFSVVFVMGEMLAPVLASVVLAYLLEGLVQNLRDSRTPRLVAVNLVFLLFLTFLLFSLFILFPLLSKQLSQLVQELPTMATAARELLSHLPERYPDIISLEQVSTINKTIREAINELGQNVLSYSLSSIPALITLAVYLVLVPLLIFFFLKDKDLLLAWFQDFLPKDHTIATSLWSEMDKQMGNYVRGKFYEIIIVGAVTYVSFTILGLNYTPLLAVLVGLSVIVPYLGAAVVTVPVLLVGFFQWGWGTEFAWVVSVYAIIQALDGNILVPLLFSEAVNLHPVAIIVAVLVFGGLWGFWGVFFAIPLATLVKALLVSWPRTHVDVIHRTEI